MLKKMCALMKEIFIALPIRTTVLKASKKGSITPYIQRNLTMNIKQEALKVVNVLLVASHPPPFASLYAML